LIELRTGTLSLELLPEIGGSIGEFRLGGKPLLRPTTADAVASIGARGCASYPLVPYSNRLANNRFSFAGRSYDLPPSLNGQAIHGVGWRHPWQVVSASPTTATIAYEHAPDADWPFAFRAEQWFMLDEHGLSCRFAATNLAPHPAPMGFGPHPFFARPPGTTLRFAAECVWLQDDRKIPTSAIAVPPEWDFSAGRALDGVALDHCFSNWGCQASIELPYARIDLSAGALFRHLIVFIPEGRDFFAVEPVTNLTDGLNRMDSEPMSNIVMLQPQQRVEAGFRLTVTAR
jgi:aldose 1-epimerase